ncbi:hypothetical protein [Raoultella terrigena]|jgi:hypothetical protein|uniref:hypothetical protein n=1 Tax=Raoultella terrigena TaxID=577 RepID=UPI003BAAD4CC
MKAQIGVYFGAKQRLGHDLGQSNVRIRPEVNNGMTLKILHLIEFAKLFFCMP